MITVISEFRLPEPVSKEQGQALFLGSAPKYQQADGLIRKYYLLSEDGNTVSGVYLWDNRAAAEAMFDANWKAFIQEKYGSEPKVTYFDTPVVVDNVTHEVVEAEY